MAGSKEPMASPLRTGAGLVLAVSVGIRSHRPCPTIWKAVTHHELPQGLCQRLTPHPGRAMPRRNCSSHVISPICAATFTEICKYYLRIPATYDLAPPLARAKTCRFEIGQGGPRPRTARRRSIVCPTQCMPGGCQRFMQDSGLS